MELNICGFLWLVGHDSIPLLILLLATAPAVKNRTDQTPRRLLQRLPQVSLHGVCHQQ
jgi:hypothetical protein